MEFQKTVNFLDTSFDNKDLPKFLTKKWVEVYEFMINHKKIMMLTKKLESKHQC